MNPLEEWLDRHNITNHKHVMNMLQHRFGVISDNCVWPRDVARTDCFTAIAVLKKALCIEEGNA